MSIRIEIETRSIHEIQVNLPDGTPPTAETVRTLLLEPGDLGVAPKDIIEDDPPPHLIADRWIRAIEVDVPNPAYAGPDTLFGNPPEPTIVDRIEL